MCMYTHICMDMFFICKCIYGHLPEKIQDTHTQNNESTI